MKNNAYLILIGLILSVFFFTSCSDQACPCLNIIKKSKIERNRDVACSIVYSDGEKLDSIKAFIKYNDLNSDKDHKHSFDIRLEKKYRMAQLPSDEDWILNANYLDKTFMKNKLNNDLFREMNPNNKSAKSSYINLNINQKYIGLYLITEKINASLLGLDKFDKLSMAFKDPSIFSKDDTNSYIDSINFYHQEFPNVQLVNHSNYLSKFKTFLFESTDQDFAEHINYWIDLDNFIDWHILLLFSHKGDGILKNFYLYKINSHTPFKVAICDYDHTFGRESSLKMKQMRQAKDCNRSILWKRLTNNKLLNYNTKLKKRWIELRNKGVISMYNINSHIVKNNLTIQSEIKANFKRWPLNGKNYYNDNSYKEELALILKYTNLRIDYLDQYFSLK